MEDYPNTVTGCGVAGKALVVVPMKGNQPGMMGRMRLHRVAGRLGR